MYEVNQNHLMINGGYAVDPLDQNSCVIDFMQKLHCELWSVYVEGYSGYTNPFRCKSKVEFS